MSKAYICDRCGATTIANSSDGWIRIDILLIGTHELEHASPLGESANHLCGLCTEGFRMWWNRTGAITSRSNDEHL